MTVPFLCFVGLLLQMSTSTTSFPMFGRGKRKFKLSAADDMGQVPPCDAMNSELVHRVTSVLQENQAAECLLLFVLLFFKLFITSYAVARMSSLPKKQRNHAGDDAATFFETDRQRVKISQLNAAAQLAQSANRT